MYSCNNSDYYNADIDLFRPNELLELIPIIEVGQLRHFLNEIVEETLPIQDGLLVILTESIFVRDCRNKAARPPLFHGLPELPELVEAAVHLDGSIFILSLN